MTVVIKDIQGMTGAEILDALHDIRPDQQIATGHGGFVVDEETALEFLRAYLIATGRLTADTEKAAPAKRGITKKGARP